jgi:hypothetical protein
LNPDGIVIGGQLSSSEWLLDGIRESIERYAQPGAARAVDVIAGSLGPRASAFGAPDACGRWDQPLAVRRLRPVRA